MNGGSIIREMFLFLTVNVMKIYYLFYAVVWSLWEFLQYFTF